MAIRKDWRKLVSGMGIILRFLVRYMPPENSKFHLTLIFFLANCKTFFFSADYPFSSWNKAIIFFAHPLQEGVTHIAVVVLIQQAIFGVFQSAV